MAFHFHLSFRVCDPQSGPAGRLFHFASVRRRFHAQGSTRVRGDRSRLHSHNLYGRLDAKEVENRGAAARGEKSQKYHQGIKKRVYENDSLVEAGS